jgi:hypothetical protein
VKTLTRNVGDLHRVALIVVGLVVTSMTVVGPATWWALIGLLPLIGGFWGW